METIEEKVTERTTLLPDRGGASKNSLNTPDLSDEEPRRKTPTLDDGLPSPGISLPATPLPTTPNPFQGLHGDQPEQPPEHPLPDPEPNERNIEDCPCFGICCLNCTKHVLKHKQTSRMMFIIVMVFSILLLLLMISIAFYIAEVVIQHESMTSLRIPANTVFRYPLKDTRFSKLFFHKGITVTITYKDEKYITSLVQVAVTREQPSTSNTYFEHTVESQQSIVRYWKGQVSGNITCNQNMTIIAKKISVITNNNLKKTTCPSSSGIQCSSTGITVSDILSNATGNGELIEMTMCNSGNGVSAKLQFSESLFKLSRIPLYDIYQTDDNKVVSLSFGNILTHPSRYDKNPCLYISTLYLESETKQFSLFPIQIDITFSDTWGYYVGCLIVSCLLVVLAGLLLHCYCKHQNKQSCTVGCLYYERD